MLQGDAIREITLEGPGAGGIETASAVVADLVSVVGTAGTGFLQNDACWRELPRLDPGAWRSPFYVHLEVADRPGVLAHVTSRLAAHDISVAQLVQHLRRRRGDARPRPARGAQRGRGGGDRRGGDVPRDAAPPVRAARDLGAAAVTVTLGEGGTPLLAAPRLSERLGVELWLKWDGANPTGSFKDRGMAVAVTRALEAGATGIVCASTGNTAASAAAYAARAGLHAVVLTAARRRRPRQGRPGAGGRRRRSARSTAPSTTRTSRPAGSPPRRASSTSTRSTPTGSRARAGRPSRSSSSSAAVPDVLALPFGGGGNTVAYAQGFPGWDTANGCRGSCSARRPGAATRSPPRSGSSSPCTGPRSTGCSSGRAAASSRSPRSSSSAPGRRSSARRGSSASRRARPGSPRSRRRSSQPGTRVVCVITGHGLKDPDAVEKALA